MDLSDITAALSNAAPYAGAITAIADLGIDITKLIDPSQNYDQAHQDRCADAANLISALVQNPGPDSGAAFSTFLRRMLAADGRPVAGGIPTVELTIGVDDLLALCCGTSEGLEYRELFAQLSTASGNQVTAPEKKT